MFCIAAFLVFGVLAIFSASFRPLAAKAWHCTGRRVTFRPCDISFGEEMRGKVAGKLLRIHPRLARWFDRWADWISLAFVALSVWSLLYVANAGLNLWVYDTCDPLSAESCSLSGEACGVEKESLGIVAAIGQSRIGEWAAGPFIRFAETLSRIPDRLRTWAPEDYLAPTATFRAPKDETKPYAVEVIDPGCKFCKKLTGNMRESGALDALNASYVLYPIPTPDGKTKFPHSRLVAATIEAAKLVPLRDSDVPGDWRLLEEIFRDVPGEDIDLQTRINIGMTDAEARAELRTLLKAIGYSGAEVDRIVALAASDDVAHSLDEQRMIVEEKIRTIKIPTLLIGGRRFDRVVDVDRLRDYAGR